MSWHGYAANLEHGMLPVDDGAGANSLVAVLSKDGAIKRSQQESCRNVDDVSTCGRTEQPSGAGQEQRCSCSCWTGQVESRIMEGSAQATTMSIGALVPLLPRCATLALGGSMVEMMVQTASTMMRR